MFDQIKIMDRKVIMSTKVSAFMGGLGMTLVINLKYKITQLSLLVEHLLEM